MTLQVAMAGGDRTGCWGEIGRAGHWSLVSDAGSAPHTRHRTVHAVASTRRQRQSAGASVHVGGQLAAVFSVVSPPAARLQAKLVARRPGGQTASWGLGSAARGHSGTADARWRRATAQAARV